MIERLSSRPLAGRRVLVTRAAEQAEGLAAPLRERGAEPVVCSTIEVVPPEDLTPLDRALERLDVYDWVVFTSTNAARFVGARLEALGLGPEHFVGARVAVIGPATAKAVRALGLDVALMPREYVGEALFEAWGPDGVRGRRFLLPRAAQARDVFPRSVRAAGGRVDVVAAYRTRVPPEAQERLEAALAEGALDAAVFTSGSTVEHFARLAGGAVEAGAALRGAVIACIGPIAAAAARGVGLTVDVVPNDYTIPGVIAALEAFFTAGASSADERQLD